MVEASAGDQEHREFYLEAIRRIVESFNVFIGDKVSLQLARQAPLDIDPEGTIHDYYGSGETAIKVLVDQYKVVLGEPVTVRRVRRTMVEFADQDELLPQKIRPREQEEKDPLAFIRKRLYGIFSAVKIPLQ